MELDCELLDNGEIEFLFYPDGIVKYRTTDNPNECIEIQDYISERYYQLPNYMKKLGISSRLDALGTLHVIYGKTSVLVHTEIGKKIVAGIQEKLHKDFGYFYPTISLMKFLRHSAQNDDEM